MSDLAMLAEPRTFPPKRFLLIVWIITLVVALYGIVATLGNGRVSIVWLAISIIGFWQLWTIRWVQVDNEGIRIRNIFQRGRELRWDQITRFHEEEVRLNKGAYSLMRLSNEGAGAPRPTRIDITSDQIGFDILRDIVREAAPKNIEDGK
jgi:hypothetical protein